MSGADEPATPRDIGRGWAKELQARAEAEGKPARWFEDLYTRAGGKAEFIPWEMAAPRFRLRQWLDENPGAGRMALDVGCGLGDNAACLAAAGYKVTAFDISQTAVQWASERSEDPGISFRQADLFDLPKRWHGAFDLVHETYNLQAMPHTRVDEAIRAIAELVRPGGTLLVMTRARETDDVPSGPPWPLTRDTLEGFSRAGLALSAFEGFDDERSQPIPHFLGVWTRVAV